MDASHVAAFFFDLGDSADGSQGGVASFLRRHAGSQIFLDLLFQVELNFAVQLPVGVGPLEQ